MQHPVRVISLPNRIGRKNDIGRPPWNGAGRKKDRVADSLVPATSPIKHSRQHGHVEIGVIVDAHLALPVVQTMQPARVLRDRSPPRDRKRQKQRVQTWVVESLANVLAGREDDSPFLPRDGCETVIDRLALLLPMPARRTTT